MIGIKDQCFGVEIEMTGLTRERAAQVLSEYFGTDYDYIGGTYETYAVQDLQGRTWKLMRDGSIDVERRGQNLYRGGPGTASGIRNPEAHLCGYAPVSGVHPQAP